MQIKYNATPERHAAPGVTQSKSCGIPVLRNGVWRRTHFHALACLVSVLLGPPDAFSDTVFPGRAWQRIEPPEKAGFSSEKLSEAKRIFDGMASNAFIVVYRGKILVAWGNIDEKLDVYSVRKSFLSALYGIYVGEGKIDTARTLADLGVDDDEGLTAREKTARIVDLLRARSGIYHHAAYETDNQKTFRPDREEHPPGQYWFYNNWDFNALGGIFQQLTGLTVFEAFKRRLAEPLGMQDFEVSDGRFHKEYVSRFPAYPFKMTARDMARLGWLFANKGRWAGRQIVPEDWVRESTRTHSVTDRSNSASVGYGYMWWTARPGKRHFKNRLGDDAFSARGNGGQYIIVAPSAGLVVVHTADWRWTGKKVRSGEVGALLKAVLAARTGPQPEPVKP
jgi:CubicO group peptidase (beta-lactamase class C family)